MKWGNRYSEMMTARNEIIKVESRLSKLLPNAPYSQSISKGQFTGTLYRGIQRNFLHFRCFESRICLLTYNFHSRTEIAKFTNSRPAFCLLLDFQNFLSLCLFTQTKRWHKKEKSSTNKVCLMPAITFSHRGSLDIAFLEGCLRRAIVLSLSKLMITVWNANKSNRGDKQ